MQNQQIPLGPNVAVIEDHEPLRENILMSLNAYGLNAWGVGSAEAFYREAVARTVDIVLIDLGLPGEDGLEAIQHLRKLKTLGIIAVTARGSHEEQMLGLEAGADHYFIKPVDLTKLLTAIIALWRRLKNDTTNEEPFSEEKIPYVSNNTQQVLTWYIDPLRMILIAPNKIEISLSSNETKLLNILANTPGLVMAKEELCAHIFPDNESVDYHRAEMLLSRLRRKIKDQGLVLPLRSIFGRGVSFTAPLSSC